MSDYFTKLVERALGPKPTVRGPFDSEMSYFKANPHVAGMMGQEDDNVVLNPYSGSSPQEQESVVKNEMARIWMRQNEFQPSFQVTPEQQQMFSGTDYADKPMESRQSLIARMLAKDPSAGQTTPEQRGYANFVEQMMNRQ